MNVSHLTNSGARLIYSAAPTCVRDTCHVCTSGHWDNVSNVSGKNRRALHDLSAVLHVRQTSVTPPTCSRCLSASFPPPQITLTSSNLGRTISLIVVKGRLGAAQSVNATQINQRLTPTLLLVPLLVLFLGSSNLWRRHRKEAELNESVNEYMRTSRTYASISGFRILVRGRQCKGSCGFLLCVRCWQSCPCFSVQEQWDSSRFRQSTPPHKHSAHYSQLLLLLQTCFKPPLPHRSYLSQEEWGCSTAAYQQFLFENKWGSMAVFRKMVQSCTQMKVLCFSTFSSSTSSLPVFRPRCSIIPVCSAQRFPHSPIA